MCSNWAEGFGSTNSSAYGTSQEIAMFTKVKFGGALVALVCIVVGPMTNRASAVSVEVAKKCNALAAKAFPPRVTGNPAAGSAKGNGRAKQAYFEKCVANGGHMDAEDGKQAK
jgi:hypothetical protein